jgi:LruC domain-containing protein
MKSGFLKISFPVFVPVVLTAVLLMAVTACNKVKTTALPSDSIEKLVIPSGFNWATTENVLFTLSAQDNAGSPLSHVTFFVYTAHPDSGGKFMFSGSTDASGKWIVTQPVPSYFKKLTVTTKYLGLQREMNLAINNNKIEATFGGKAPAPLRVKSFSSGPIKSAISSNIFYMGTYDSQGVPNYLDPSNDVVDQSLLNDLNSTLPEYQSVPVYHPQFLASNAPCNLELLEKCDVWITYITEGAGWQNAVGYFLFNTNNPPTSSSQIDTIKIIFPNLSNNGSGGGLYPGNRVYLGRYPAGKSLGWVIFANGWDGVHQVVTNGNYLLYSIPGLNPESDPNLQKHTLLLNDPNRLKFMFSFEDWRRDQGSDQDFNDGILYVKATPVTAVNTVNMPVIHTTMPDQDGDGVPDNQDDYPNDPTMAHNNYYPSQTGYASLAFEDLWPSMGDYDFNDLVISYRFNQITNADNAVVKIQVTLITEAMGATLHNAFGFQMGCTPAQVSGVTGLALRHNLVTLLANNCEAGQSKAVIIPYDDAYDRLPYPGTGIGSNTTVGAPYVTPDTMQLTITLNQPVDIATIGTPPYNPFLIVNQVRGQEIHMVDNPPTDKANPAFFGTADDNSLPSSVKYYKTATNLPWLINIAEKFNYMIEQDQIVTGYLKFGTWAQSTGSSYPDWYKALSGYRDNTKIYTH